MFACLHGPSADLSQIAEAFSPFFEQTTPDTVVFCIHGLKRLYGTPHQIADAIAHRAGTDVNISVAQTAESAILAARNFSGVTVNPELNTLDVTTLPLTDEMAEVLDSWGIHTLQQLAQLPETGIAERFGPAGISLQRLARGAVNRPLKIFQPEVTYDDRIQLDHPVDLLEPLLFLIARMLNDQCEKLQSHGMAANEITLRLELENKTEHVRTLCLPIPMRESKALLKLLQMDLEAHPPQDATVSLALSLKPVNPRTVQSGIFLPVTPAPDKLELTLARIRGIVGENNVGVPELLNTHHPHPFRLAQKQPQLTDPSPVTPQHAFRYFRPPLAATVELQNDSPARITASGIHGKVLKAAGPWRTSGDWWTTTPWNRDEWDITLANGALYRIYREPDQHWFLEGSYD
jgi:protein ImuB